MTLLKKYSIVLPIVIITVVMSMQKVAGQENPENVKVFLARVQNAYRQAAFLGFRVKYEYANANKPEKYLDSLSGEVEMDKNRFRFIIDGTETLVTDNHTVYVMNDDKIIYLSSAKKKGILDPVALLDSMTTQLVGVKAEISVKDKSEYLTLIFPPGQMYSQIIIIADSQTGLLQKIEYTLHNADLVGQEMIEHPGHPGPYQPEGKVDILFSHYKLGNTGNNLLNEANYFTRIGNRFEPTGKYKNYRIFLASPNL